ncbi:MAG: glycosyltransferase [Candidatus Marinimicrobia bacterium]|nr:glycosyltransferase [Candidatus Neomarinimicrobiota bacterium]
MEPLLSASDNSSFQDKRIALLYDDIVRPDTTGVYCRNALEKICNVTHFQPTELDKVPQGFDLYLFIDDGFRYFLPERLKPSAWWVIDTHLNYEDNLRSVGQFDYVFTAQKDGARKFRNDGILSAKWLPLACDPNQHQKVKTEKKYDVVFVGNELGAEREKCLNGIKKHFPNHFIGRKFFNEMAETFSQGRIVFNRSVKNDVNMRVFEALSTGSLLLTNKLDENGQGELFEEGKHLVNYNGESDLIEKIKYYLEHENEREKIAEAGMDYVHKNHSYQHRMGAILQSVFSENEVRLKSKENLQNGLCSIVILTHNQVEYTKLCLESIESFLNVDIEIIFVDNASTDDTIEYLTGIVEKNKNYSLITNSENRGYAAGNNMGINAAIGEFVLIMNNDILVTKGAVETLINLLKNHEQTVLVGPKTNFVKGSQLDLEAEYGSIEEMLNYAERNSKKNKGKTAQTEFLVGFMFLGRTKLLKEAGGFDESSGIGNYEDNDLCRKLSENGYELRIAEDSFVHHFGHVSFNASSVDYNELIEKNKKIYEDKWSRVKDEKVAVV